MIYKKSRRSLFTSTAMSYGLGATLWTLLSIIQLRFVPKVWWQYRDDSVIHLSQSLNLVQFGSVGLSPGGRVEAMSSPLNFLISLPFFTFNKKLDFTNYLDGYLLVTLLLLGTSVSYAINQVSKKYKLSLKLKIIFHVSTYALFTSSWTTFGWVISGMENVLIVILLSLLIGLLAHNQPRLDLLIFVIVLLGISRIEMPVFLSLIYLGVLRFSNFSKNQKLKLILIPLGFWSIFHSIRFAYYGELFPNTASALGKSLSILPIALFLLQVIMICHKFFGKQQYYRIRFNVSLLFWPFFLILSLLRIRETTYELSYKIALISCLIAISMLFIVILHFNDSSMSLNLALMITLIPLNHFVFFGPARLSAFRIVSIFVLPIILVFVWVLLDKYSEIFLKSAYLSLFIFTVITIALFINRFDYERNLCCAISPSDKIILSNSKNLFASNGPKPIVANPDLGKISFSKKTINVDLGLIGDPLLSKLTREKNNVYVDYLLNYAAPDVVELHGHWMCVYSDLLSHPKFPALWDIKLQEKVSSEFNVPEQLNCPQKGMYTIWQRNIPKAEKELSELISMESKSKAIEKVAREVYSCASISAELHRCQYVTRSIIRNREYLIKKGWLNDVTELMKKSPTYLLDKLRIEEPAGWSKEAARIFSKF